GDRRVAAHWCGQPDQVVAVRDRRHAGRPDRAPVLGRLQQAALRLALLPRADPACDRRHLQPVRADDRPPLRLRLHRAMSTVDLDRADEVDQEVRPFDPAAPLIASGNLRRRKIVSAIVQSAATAAAVVAVVVLVIVVWSVFRTGAWALT